jgi:hypothetical protein
MPGIGPDHPHSLAARHALAALYREQGRRAEARAACAECARARARVLGPEHADTLVSERMLAELDGSQGSDTQPEELRAEASLVASKYGRAGLHRGRVAPLRSLKALPTRRTATQLYSLKALPRPPVLEPSSLPILNLNVHIESASSGPDPALSDASTHGSL